MSILVVLIYSWRIGVNFKKYETLQDVYYGVQIAYLAIIGTQLFMIVLSIILLFGIYKVSDKATCARILRNLRVQDLLVLLLCG